MNQRRNTILMLAFIAGLQLARCIADVIPPGPMPSTVSGDVELRAGTYTGSTRVAASGTTIRGVPGTILKGAISGDNKSDVTIQGIYLEGTGLNREGIRLINFQRLKVLDCYIYNFGGNGLNVGGSNGQSDDVLVEGVTLHKNHPGSTGHCQGIYFAYVKNGRIRYCVVDTNGWDGISGDTQYNQGIYVHGTCGPTLIEHVLAVNNAATGIQDRSGGDLRFCVFWKNAVALTHGYVKGDYVYTGRAAPPGWRGGVLGEVAGNWFLGGRQSISGGPVRGPRGWMVELSNDADVHFHDNFFAHDAIRNNPAVIIKNCEDITKNPGQYLKSDSWKLLVENLYRHKGWPDGTVEKRTGGNGVIVRSDEMTLPNADADLTAALGGDFMAWARAQPSAAAPEALKRLREAAGFVSAQPTPITLESLIRSRPQDARIQVESGRATIRFLTDGTDPLWYVEGDTLIKSQP